MKTIKLNQLKTSGEVYFKLSPEAKSVYKVNHYNRDDKTYSVSPCDDINKERFIKSNKPIFIGFEY